MTATLTLTLKSKKGQTVPEKSEYQAPLLYTWKPQSGDRPAIIYLINQAGLSLGGDHFSNRVELKKKSHAIVTTQAYSKVSRGNGQEAVEITEVKVGEEATLEWISDPALLYQDASANHFTTLRLHPQSRLIWISGQMLGRIAKGENLVFKNWRHRFEIYMGQKLTFLESWNLNPEQSKKAVEVMLEKSAIMGFGLIASPKGTHQESITDLCLAQNHPFVAGVTALTSNITLVRFLAPSGESFRKFTCEFWKRTRKSMLNAEPPNLGKL